MPPAGLQNLRGFDKKNSLFEHEIALAKALKF